jgi:ATP-dependent phosphoenolpyruvate carboxykinase
LLVHGDGLLPAVARLDAGRYLLKAGRVGGAEAERGSMAISEEFVARVLDSALAGDVEWEQDPDFPYEVAAALPGVAPPEDGLLVPRFLYRRADRVYEHAALVPRVRDEVARLLESAS